MPSRKKIIRKLYKQLKKDQADDFPIPAPTLLSIKFYIKNHPHTSQMAIEDDLPSQDSSGQPPPAHPSTFILSQLEAQKVANLSSPSNQVLAVLVVTSKYLATDPLDPPTYPTLFTWHTSGNHRTYCLFAYLNCPMESRIYTASELFELRGGAFPPDDVLDTIKLNPDVADMIVKPKVSIPPPQSRRLKKAKEDISSSTESEDHILFKGKKQIPTKNGVTEWKYRGRSGSEMTSSEPLSAPTGLAAQKSEGFQRFFKAVVSPTHVRVTAGGRIVPNTRATTSPTAKWDKNRADHEARGSIDTTKNSKSEAENGAKSNVLPPAGSQLFQGHPPFIHHLGMPLPLIPMHNGIPLAYGFPPPPPPPHIAPNMVQSTSTNAKSEPEKTSSVARADDGSSTNNPQSGPVKISPPEQFDHTKPFIFNGHLIYPAMGAPPMPSNSIPALIPGPYLQHGVAGSQAALPGARMIPMGHLPPPVPMLGPHGFIPGPYGAPPSTSNPQVPQQPSHQAKPAAAPPISSIRPSEITRQQLGQLRTAAKYFEDQLQYNKHQIDEKSTVQHLEALRAKIHHFEYNLRMQTSFEATYYPKQAQSSETTAIPTPEAAASCDTPLRPPSMKENRSDTASPGDSNMSVGSGNPAPSLGHKQLSNHPRPQPKGYRNPTVTGLNAFKSDSNSSTALDALEAHIKRQMVLEKEGRANPLSGAALAPPFQPGPTPSVPSVSADGQNESLAWLAGKHNDNQLQSGSTYPQHQRGSWDTVQSTNPYLAGDSTPTETQMSGRAFGPSSYSVPYLVGTLPQGANPYTARGTDYTYARELTDEEIRARHVYWGQVPTKGTGLPKFDGKDFYPPSPVKADERSKSQPRLPIGRPDVDYAFQLPPTENDPFRSSRDGASIRSQENSQKVSRAIPIVNPDSIGRGGTSKSPNAGSALSSHADRDPTKSLKELKLASPSTSATERASDGKSTAFSRRVTERSSNRSGHDLWQTMLKKGAASGTALPSTVSSTTATGYLPQYFGHAAASLNPTISNVGSSPARVASGADGKPVEVDGSIPQGPAVKLGENRHPREESAPEADATKEIHERMLRDAERRGVIGPGWQ